MNISLTATIATLFSNLTSIAEAIAKLPATKGLSHKQIIEELYNYYQNEKLVLVLGAGVSMEYGLPGWNTLLQKLMITTIEREENISTFLCQVFTELFNPSSLIAGRYLQKYYEDHNLSFEEAVKENLYKELNTEHLSGLMAEIINYCVAPGKSPNLDSIISYNFDDILEQRLRSVGTHIPFKSIYDVGMNPDPGELPIYHVHGYLPYEEKLTENHKITFGESIYHQQYIDIYIYIAGII